MLSNNNDVESDTSAGAKAVEQWLDSPGHYMNAMNPEFTHVGYGYYKCPFNSGYGDQFWTGLYFSDQNCGKK